jgi:hypothetical protein
MNITSIRTNPNNPRLIKDESFSKLVASIKDFPKMMELRPIIVDKEGVILGGNMRYRALLELKYTEIPDNWVKKANDLTEEEKRKFIIKDNIEFGKWNYDILSSEYETQDLLDWGLSEQDLQLNDFSPNLLPSFGGDDVTKEEINKKAIELAEQMMKEKLKLEVICPECGHEFVVDSRS